MKARIRDTGALSAVSPAALSAYVRALGWERSEACGDHSDVYAADRLPEIILPADPSARRLRERCITAYRNLTLRRFLNRTSWKRYTEISVTADRDVIRESGYR